MLIVASPTNGSGTSTNLKTMAFASTRLETKRPARIRNSQSYRVNSLLPELIYLWHAAFTGTESPPDDSLAGGRGLLLPGLLSEMLAAEPDDPLAPRKPHHAAKAKQVIFLFMTGGVSHVDTFDPKPFLRANHDQPHGRNQVYKGADWEFRRYGQSGIEVSDLFPEIGKVADEIAVVRSMKNINGDHFGATLGIHTGSATFNRPSIGSWVSYGLGTFNRNLPSFMVIAPEIPYAGGQVWGSTFFPCCIRARASSPARSRSPT